MITGNIQSRSGTWPAEQAKVVRRLVARGVSAADAEDALQDAVVRAIVNEVHFHDDEHQRRWLTTVSWRIAVDTFRRNQRTTGLEGDSTRDVHQDPATVIEQREAARAVLDGLGRLRTSDRQVLLTLPTAAPDRRTAVRENVRRHRARQRLLALVDGFLAWVGWIRHRDLSKLATKGGAVMALPLAVSLLGSWSDTPPVAAGRPTEQVASGSSPSDEQRRGARQAASLAAAAWDGATETFPAPSPPVLAADQEVATPATIAEVTVPIPTADPAVGGLREADGEPEFCADASGDQACVDITTRAKIPIVLSAPSLGVGK